MDNVDSGDERIIKKYSNRRLYDTAISRYITLEDVRKLVKDGVRFRVVDAKTEEDITRNILLQVILEQEGKGQPIFTTGLLEQFIRTYGDNLQGFMTSYLEESIDVFARQQKVIQEQMASVMQTAPLSVFSDLARRNLSLWQSLQEKMLKAYGFETPKPAEGDSKPEERAP